MGAAVPVSEPALQEESALHQPKWLFILPLVPFRIQPHSVLFRLVMHTYTHTPLKSFGAFFMLKYLSLSETRVLLQGNTLLHKSDRNVIILIGFN